MKPAPRYEKLTAAAGGAMRSFCQLPWDGWFPAKSAQPQSFFYLSRAPIIGSVRVKVDGKVIPEGTVAGWYYDPAGSRVTFVGKYVPHWGAKIELTYRVPCS